MPMHILPKTPSVLIRLALADLKQCEADPTYEIDMASWHTPSVLGVCQVCLAGAVMAKSLESPKVLYLMPGDTVNRDQLLALNSFRTGDVTNAFHHLHIAPTTSVHMLNRYIRPYSRQPEGFVNDLHELANLLEREGF